MGLSEAPAECAGAGVPAVFGGMVGFAFENSNKPNDEKVDSTCVGIQSIKSMMLKMGGICKVTDNGGSFCIVIAFKGYKYWQSSSWIVTQKMNF